MNNWIMKMINNEKMNNNENWTIEKTIELT